MILFILNTMYLFKISCTRFNTTLILIEQSPSGYTFSGNPSFKNPGAPPWSSGSVLDHGSLPLVFEYRRGHM